MSPKSLSLDSVPFVPITSLNCILNVYNKTGNYSAIILVPTISLAVQWEEELESFNFKNVIMKLISKLHTSIYFMVCSSFLLSFCPDLDRDKIKYELRSDKMSYINSLQSDDKWIVGTVHGHQDQLYAEKMAISSLSLHIRSQVSEEIIQEIESLTQAAFLGVDQTVTLSR